MKRKEFLKKSILTGAAATLAPSLLNATSSSEENSTPNIIGFNHLPTKEEKTMNTVLHKANTRGLANHGWLNSHHSFSFASWYNPDRMGFGALRVLNDDRVAGGQGFGRHPHDNMEIISIPLEGDLEHQDSMGTKAVIKEGEIQVMSAGTGVYHSEYNKNTDKEVKFLQIWVFPKKRNVTPRYDQISIAELKKENAFYQVLSPSADDQGVWVHQDAWFHLGEFAQGKTGTYQLNKPDTNGVYLFVLEGDVTVNGQALNKRDGYGMWDTTSFELTADSNAKVLVMEVPMA